MSVIGDGGAIFAGTLGQGSTEIFSQVTNSYLLWYPNRGAIRGGAAQPYPTGLYSIAFGGAGLSASGDYSVAFGESGEAYGLRTFAVNGLALGTDAIGIGRGSYANGDRSVALGTQSLAIYDGSVAVGDDTFSNGVGSAAIGTGANAHGNYSVAVGNGVWSEDLGSALGHSLMAGGNSIALGISSVAFDYSIALGVNSLALGSSSIVIGRDLVAGYQTVVIGAKNVPEGSITEWVETDPLFVVGNGRESPSNAFVILKNGDVRIPKRQGDILMGEFGN
jgi:hypothetical protein